MKLKRVLFLLLFVFSNVVIWGQVATLDENNAAQIRQQTFDRVWTIVNERHFDPTFGGVDWKKVGESYRPTAMAANNDIEFHSVLSQMINELNQSHFSIYTKENEVEATRCNDGIVGIDLRLLDGKAVVTKVDEGSSADKAGIKMGFEIAGIDGKTISEMLLPIETNFAVRKLTEAMKQTYRERLLTRSLCGKPQTSVKIEALNKQNSAKTFTLTRNPFKGKIAKVAEGMPPFKLLFESKILPENIGYVSFNIWIPQQADKARDAIREMKDVKGIIIDLRGNSGGQGNLVNNVGGTMFHTRTSFGKTKTRFSGYDFWVVPQNQIYDGKVVILTNSGTGSTSEIFAAGMKDTGRAKIIGEKTAGAVLPATIEKLPTGANFMYAVADYRSPKGILIEGLGVEPDVEIHLTRQTLLAGRDLQMEEAIRELLK